MKKSIQRNNIKKMPTMKQTFFKWHGKSYITSQVSRQGSCSWVWLGLMLVSVADLCVAQSCE